MPPMLIDAHCHLDKYGDGVGSVLDEIRRESVFTVSVAVDPESYAVAKDLGGRCEFVLPTFGVHPCEAARFADRLDELRPLVEETPMIGEIGLDYHFVEDRATDTAQRRVLDFFLARAAEQDKVVNLHTKAAEDDVLAALRRHETRRAIVHWYSGPVRAFRGLVEVGAYFTIGVEVLQSDIIREIAAAVPGDRLLTETDNPGGHRRLTGDEGRPALVRDVVRELAAVRGESAGSIRRRVCDNFERLIDSDPRLAEPFRRATASD